MTSRGCLRRSLNVPTSRNYRRPSGEPQGTNTKTDDLIKNCFLEAKVLVLHILVFYSKNKYSIVLNWEVHGTSTKPSCGTSQRSYDGMF